MARVMRTRCLFPLYGSGCLGALRASWQAAIYNCSLGDRLFGPFLLRARRKDSTSCLESALSTLGLAGASLYRLVVVTLPPPPMQRSHEPSSLGRR
jgi:hypothetical protein